MKKLFLGMILAGVLIGPGTAAAQGFNSLSRGQLEAIVAALQAQLEVLLAQWRQRQGVPVASSTPRRVPAAGPTNQPPVVEEFWGPREIFVGRQGRWSVVASDPDREEPLTFNLNCGDGSRGVIAEDNNHPVFFCTYQRPGTYEASLRVTDPRGAVTTVRRVVRVFQLTTSVTAPSSPSLPTTPSPNPPPLVEGGELQLQLLNGDARCIRFPCEIPLTRVSGKIEVKDSAGQVVTTAYSNVSNGSARIELPAGTYYLAITAAGYRSIPNYKVTVSAGEVKTVKLTLYSDSTYAR